MTAATKQYIDRMIAMESRGWGDQKNAIERLARRYGLPFWSLEHARTRAKTFRDDFAAMVRTAYLAECERQIVALQNEIAAERAKGRIDALEDFEIEAAALAERLAAARQGSLPRAR
ncbi:hypothetical protein [Jiella avicenniae]|uniref:Uncharacterized protein n=1 Tax=Jiella avicenniae TaxID=2907202 RepID=A0A9X1NZN1_9HYPH|nr:hypothetical protein [Jiella avicenniae]MCE7028442.1 hypothetical protein [Jiella avicenniae]